ncbi:MAG: DNA-binding protein [Methylovulum sp.]|nr:DNA-binding protein [Methylovulum sp.]
MNGINYLLDTNIIIGLLKGNAQAVDLTQGINLSACAFSAITRMELLGFVGITDHEEKTVKALLDRMAHLSLTPAIEELTIQFRLQHRAEALTSAIRLATLNSVWEWYCKQWD